MNDSGLHALAQAAGILLRWRDYRGHEHEVAPDTLHAVLAALDLPSATPAQIAASLAALRHESALPPPPNPTHAPGVDELCQRPRPWGLSAQLYALARPGDDGLGDFTALADCARATAQAGADVLAVSPVHAPFLAEPAHCSPYMPSNRLMLNPLHVDPGHAFRCFGERERGEARGAALRELESRTLVDWPAAAATRLARLRGLFARVSARLGADQEFRAFRAHGGEELEHHARFEALQARQLARGAGRDWRQWTPELRDPRSEAIELFTRAHADEVSFHVFLQWLADRGLAAAQAAARHSGMAVGLVADLAVGVDPAGSEAWSRPRAMLGGLTLGAPPDLLNTRGQNWGLTTLSPRALTLEAGVPWRQLLRATLRHAGGLRIDHVLGLNRMWVIPQGAGPTEGAYLRYPLELLLEATAAEAQEQRALVIGEDLGTVPPGLRERLAAARLLGLSVLWFMRDHGLFVDPSRWPVTAVATTTTHDLPTVAGWWIARDVQWRARTGQLGRGEEALADQARQRDRRVLWDALLHAGVATGAAPDRDARRVIDAAVRFVARAAAPLALVPLEDIAGLDEQPNLPGTTDEHPNWRRRLPQPVESLLSAPGAAARLAILRAERNRAQAQTMQPSSSGWHSAG